jgi:hypothetical protein
MLPFSSTQVGLFGKVCKKVCVIGYGSDKYHKYHINTIVKLECRIPRVSELRYMFLDSNLK